MWLRCKYVSDFTVIRISTYRYFLKYHTATQFTCNTSHTSSLCWVRQTLDMNSGSAGTWLTFETSRVRLYAGLGILSIREQEIAYSLRKVLPACLFKVSTLLILVLAIKKILIVWRRSPSLRCSRTCSLSATPAKIAKFVLQINRWCVIASYRHLFSWRINFISCWWI